MARDICLIFFYRLLIEHVEDKDNPNVWRGYVYGISMFVVALVQSLALQHYFHVIFSLGMKVRTAVIGMVYSKVILWNVHIYVIYVAKHHVYHVNLLMCDWL